MSDINVRVSVWACQDLFLQHLCVCVCVNMYSLSPVCTLNWYGRALFCAKTEEERTALEFVLAERKGALRR